MVGTMKVDVALTRRVSLETSATISTVNSGMGALVGPWPWSALAPSDKKKYWGWIADDVFVIQKASLWRNALRPEIAGKIRQELTSVVIDMNIRLKKYVVAFSVLW